MTSKTTSNPTAAIKALQHVIDRLPAEVYGTGHARFLRRLVHIVLAKHANPDGTSIYVGQSVITKKCAGVSEYALEQAIDWLKDHGLLKQLAERHPVFLTNQYELVFPDSEVLAQAEQREQKKIQSKREKNRSKVARWRSRQKMEREAVTQAKKVTVTQQNEVTSGDCNPTIDPSVTQHFESVTQLLSSVTQLNRVSNRENPPISPITDLPSSLDRPLTPTTTPVSNADDVDAETRSLSKGKADRQVMDEIVALLQEWGCSAESTAAHRKQAEQAAQEYGLALFLSAFAFWLAKEGSDIRRVYDEQQGCGVDRKWVLQHFLSGGYLKTFTDRVKGFEHLPHKVVHFILTESDGDPEVYELLSKTMPEEAEVLNRILTDKSGYLLCSTIEQVGSVSAFVARADELMEEAYEKERRGWVAKGAQKNRVEGRGVTTFLH
jgi:hypothetical protein